MIGTRAICEATEQACAAVGLDDQAEAAISLALEILTAQVKRDKRLTPQENALVNVLSKSGERIVSVEHLAQALDIPNTHHVKVLISRVRCKSVDIGRRIETVRGYGYRMVAA